VLAERRRDQAGTLSGGHSKCSPSGARLPPRRGS
jgi:hypothetical protein